MTKELETTNSKIDQIKQKYELEFKKEFEALKQKHETELQQWIYKCKRFVFQVEFPHEQL